LETRDTIYVVITRAEPRIYSKQKVSQGSKIVCKAQTKAAADMCSGKYRKQLEKLGVGCRVIILQGGYILYREKYGSVRFVAAGVVRERVRRLQKSDILENLELWMATSRWYKNWPTIKDLSTELIIHYNLKKAKRPMLKPKQIITNPKTKVVELRDNNPVYNEVDAWWREVTKRWYY
jgi:hypothetical protein